jgi:hypothetical protein
MIPEARDSLIEARDNDGIPWRANSDIMKLILQISVEEDLLLCDVEQKFRQTSADGIIDERLIVDNCHPSIEGQYIISSSIMEVMAKNSIPVPENQWQWDQIISFSKYLTSLNIPAEVLAEQETSIAAYWMKDPFNNEERAIHHLEKALGINPENEYALAKLPALRKIARKEKKVWKNIAKSTKKTRKNLKTIQR